MELRVKKSMKVIEYKKLVWEDQQGIKDLTIDQIETKIYKEIGKKDYLYGSDTPGSLFK